MYRGAVIGLGRMGSTFDDEMTQGGAIFLPYAHAPSYTASSKVTLVAGADPHDEQRQLFGQRWGVAEANLYSDYREMLASEELDIVSVCTTARLRAAIIQDVAQAGVKAIWAEKPIALSLQEADAIVRVCHENDVALAINCSRRWNPYFSQARQLIEEGAIGTVLQITGYAQCNLSHNGSHLLDIIRYLADSEVKWVFGEMASDEAAASDEDLMGNGYLAFDNGVRSYIRTLPTGAAMWEIDVIGEHGRIRSVANCLEMEYTQMVNGGPRNRGLPAKVPFPLPTHVSGTGVAVVDDLIDAIETGRPPKCSGADGVAALEIAMALRESHRRGGIRVNLPLEDRSLTIYSAEIAQDHIPARIRRLQR